MQDNPYSLSQKKREELTSDYLAQLQQEHKKLLLENVDLKKNLENEQLLHKNLYKQWAELNGNTLVKEKEIKNLKFKRGFLSKFYKYSFYALLLTTIVFAWYLFGKGNKNAVLSSTQTNTADTTQKVSDQLQNRPSITVKNLPVEKEKATVSTSSQPSTSEPLKTTIQKNAKYPARYKVRTKAFFYNSPDESTKRNTFLLPADGPYGIITPLDDQNNFVYIIFVNHAHHTSKGWIRKVDLDLINQ